MLVSDILYLIFGLIALVFLSIYTIWIIKSEEKRKIDFEEKYKCIVNLLKKISEEE